MLSQLIESLAENKGVTGAKSRGWDRLSQFPVLWVLGTPTCRWLQAQAMVGDMTVEAIKDAIVHLSEPERQELADWFEELEEEAWDRQIERDFLHGGRGAYLLDEAKADIAAGRTKSMKEFLAEAKSNLEQSKTCK